PSTTLFRSDLVGSEVVPAGQPLHERRFAAVAQAIQFGAITRRDDDTLAHAGEFRHLAQRYGEVVFREYDFLADLDGRGAVIDSNDDEWHARCLLGRGDCPGRSRG